MSNDSILKKIQKLLNLANSDNENEAKMATNRANELLVKHNLSLQQVKDTQFVYESKDVEKTGLTLKPYQKMVASILMDYFFVRAVISKRHVGYSSGQWGKQKAQFEKIIQLVGTTENCEIASYIFSYLNDAYPRLWKEYQKNTGVSSKGKYSYYLGLSSGITKMLKETRWKVESETGLVVQKDKNLEDHMKKQYGGSSYGSDSKSDIDREVYQDGVEHGKNITLRKPIESESSNSNAKLTGKV